MGHPIVPSSESRRSKINWRSLPRSVLKLFTGSVLEPAWAWGFSLLQQRWVALELLLMPSGHVAGLQSSHQMFCSTCADVKFLFDHSSWASSCSPSHFGGWEPVVLIALSDELQKVESLQCCCSPRQGPGRALWLWNVGWSAARSSCPSLPLVFAASYLEEQEVPKWLGSCFAGRERWDPVTLVMVKISLFWNMLPRSPCALRRWPSSISCSARKHRKVRFIYFFS